MRFQSLVLVRFRDRIPEVTNGAANLGSWTTYLTTPALLDLIIGLWRILFVSTDAARLVVTKIPVQAYAAPPYAIHPRE